MKEYKLSSSFKKKISKLKGQELFNLNNKINEICSSSDINHYKNLKYSLKQFKRVHVNNSYVILFVDKDNTIYFVDYAHHDKIYVYNKRILNKLQEMIFD